MKLKIILTTILTMTTLLNYAQDNGLMADGWVQPVSYTINGTDQTDWIERMDVIKKEDGSVECRVQFKDNGNTEYWNFQTKNVLQLDQTVSGTLHAISMESNDWAYSDDKAHGTFTSDRNTGVETLDIYFHFHQSDDIHNVISWMATEIVNERWTEEGNSENHITWHPDGTFSFSETNAARTCSAFGSGTYISQINHGIREIFVQAGDMDVKQAISDTTKYEIRDKRYFMILEMNDSIVKVHTIPPEYEIGWVIEPNGKYELIFPNDDIDGLPVMLKRYKRSKEK